MRPAQLFLPWPLILVLAFASVGSAAGSKGSSPSSSSSASSLSSSPSTVDVHVAPGALDIAVTVHVSDVAHELSVNPPESLLDPQTLARVGDSVVWLVKQRLQISAGIRSLGEGTWTEPEPLPEQQALRLQAHYDVGGQTGIVSIEARLFPQDRAHQTFVNIYEGETLQTKAILDRTHPRFLYFATSHE